MDPNELDSTKYGIVQMPSITIYICQYFIFMLKKTKTKKPLSFNKMKSSNILALFKSGFLEPFLLTLEQKNTIIKNYFLFIILKNRKHDDFI